MMVVDNEFELGQIVYLKTDKEQLPRIVVRFTVRPCGITYCLASGATETYHDNIEISPIKDVVISTTN